MVPYIILQCLLLSYISAQVTAQFRPSPGFSRGRPQVSGMRPPGFELKPPTFNRNMETQLGPSGRKDQKPEGKVLETQLGGFSNNGKLLPPRNKQNLDIFKASEKTLGKPTPGKDKIDPPPYDSAHHIKKLEKTLESHLVSSKEIGEHVLHNNDHKVGLPGKNKETPKIVKNDHPPYNNNKGSLEKTLESNLQSSKENEENGEHPPPNNDHEVDLPGPYEEELKKETAEINKNDHPPHIHNHHEGSLEKTLESNMESNHFPHMEDHELDLPGTNEKEINGGKPEQGKNGYPPHIPIYRKESSDDHDYKIRHQINPESNKETSTSGSFLSAISLDVVLYVILGFILIITLHICYKCLDKKCLRSF